MTQPLDAEERIRRLDQAREVRERIGDVKEPQPVTLYLRRETK